ncbi:hypothetical protein [Mesoflavibacter zeaxanthinifaciens]|uniref:hypothetical protein n=1 Tax=Mesoflavibacter zeaxanthinifaciens TaxID=393060 RepID=UPI0003FB0465|nr:hypothetical protein [Mesoflavibacter zeaxanthinifaciens]
MTTTESGKIIFIVIAIGIWAIVLQNAGIISTKQNVYVKGGYIDADVSGSVDIDNAIEIDGTIDVNIDEINGYDNAFYQDRDGAFMVLPTTNRLKL